MDDELRDGGSELGTEPRMKVTPHRLASEHVDGAVIVIGADGHHLTLRVIAPDTNAHAAQAALAEIPERADDESGSRRSTPAARSVADVAQRLAQHEGREDEQRTAVLPQSLGRLVERRAGRSSIDRSKCVAYQTLVTTAGKPLSPSQTTKKVS